MFLSNKYLVDSQLRQKYFVKLNAALDYSQKHFKSQIENMILIKEHRMRKQVTWKDNEEPGETSEEFSDDSDTNEAERYEQEIVEYQTLVEQQGKEFFNSRKKERKSWLSKFSVIFLKIDQDMFI